MANSFAGNVHFVDTTATALEDARRISAIKYIGASSGTVVITDTKSGNNVWQGSGSTDFCDQGLNILVSSGVTVTITNSAKVYIYLTAR